MTTTPIIIIGGGEHARVVADAVRSTETFRLLGFVDIAGTPDMARRVGAPLLGDDSALDRYPEAHIVLGVGALRVTDVRERIVRSLGGDRRRWATVVHQRAWVSPSALLAQGAFVSAGAVVQAGADVGAHAIVNTGAVVEHDVVIGEYAQVGPSAAIGGASVVGARAYVGLGARVRDHIEVGAGAMVAMGAVVVKNVPPGARVAGVPAKELP